MAHNEPQDEEQEAERLIRDYFASERSDIQVPDDLWLRLESRLGQQRGSFQPSAILDSIFPTTSRWRNPALATAGVAAIAVAVTMTVLYTGGGEGAPDTLLGPDAADSGASAQYTPEGEEESPNTQLEPGAPDHGASAEYSPIEDAHAPEATAELLALATTAPDSTMAPQATAESEAMMEAPTPAADYALYEEEAMSEEGEVHPDVAAAREAAAAAEAAAQAAEAAGSATAAAAGSVLYPISAAGAATVPVVPRAGTPSATEFQDYGRLSFVSAFDDPVSTFSLDTDRTSYHLALNWARNGYVVEPDSVRAEEWINAFDYGYQPPSSQHEFAIYSDVARHPLDDRLHLARVAFQAPEIRDDTPLNVTLVLDASGSMSSGNRVDIARAAAEAIRESLGSGDRIAVVHFTNSVIHELTVDHSRPDDRDVSRSISNLEPHGSTNVQAGLDLGVKLADQARQERPNAYNYIILMSDGVANVDATDPFAILESAYDPDRGNPLRIITVGVGIENYNDHLLEQLAQHGDGWYRYLSDVEQARATFNRQNWLALSAPFADQARAQVTWDPDIVQSWRIVGYENRVTPDATFTQDRKEFAELPSGAATTVFYELELHPEWDRSTRRQRLAGLEVKWVDPSTGNSRSQTGAVEGHLNVGFQRHSDHRLQLGAIVGLAADRYSGLNDERRGYESYLTQASRDLDRLLDLLDPLQNDLGKLVAYNDFRFLLEHIAGTVRARAPEPTTPSGYSP